MANSAQDIIQELKDRVSLARSENPDWYISAAEDPEKRLFEGHGIVQDKHWYFIREASSPDEAKTVVDHYRKDKMGGADPEAGATKVYAYRKGDGTKP